MKIIDMHANIGEDISNSRKKLTPASQTFEQLLEKMNEHKIARAVVVPFPSPVGQFNKNAAWYDLENPYLIEAYRYSKRFIPFPAVNPGDEQSVKNIGIMATSFNVKGVKFSHQIPMKFSIDKLINHPLMKIVQDNNLILMIHIGTGKESGAEFVHTTLNYAIKVARNYPDVKFIFCHLGRLHWSLLEALNFENVYFDTAALSMWEKQKEFIAAEPMAMFKSTVPTQIIEALYRQGYEDKLLFGSDEPYTHYRSEIAAIANADISLSAKRKIFYENAEGLLK